MKSFNISAELGKGERLDAFLAKQTKGVSRTKVKKMISQGLVLVDGVIAKPSFQLEGTENVSYSILPINGDSLDLNPENIPLEVLFEDDEIIALNKQAGITVHPGAGKSSGTLANGLLFHFNKLSDVNGNFRPGIVHRLDKDTSGAILIAKNNSAHANLSKQFERRLIKKKYYAIAWGEFRNEKGEIDAPIARGKKDPTSYVVDSKGKEAKTLFQSNLLGHYASEVSFYPETGRTHQIRVHSSSIGNPIFGDEKYGGGISRSRGYIPEVSKKLLKLLQSFRRHALHAEQITFTHPKIKKQMTVTAKLPKDLKMLKKNLGNIHD